MENLENVVKNVKNNGRVIRGYGTKYNSVAQIKDYSIFSEQYLEKPVVSGDTMMAMSPTACTIKHIPVIDDF